MAEENNSKSKRDLMWEQKKKMREERLRSTDNLPQTLKIQNQNQNNNDNDNDIHKNLFKSDENIKIFSQNPPQDNRENRKFNIFEPNVRSPIQMNQNIQERPTKQNEIQPFYNNQKFEPTVNNDFNYQNNQNFALPNNKINSSFGNQQQSIEYPKNDGNFNKSPNYQNNPLPQEDPNLITKVIKKEYGEFLKNQMKEKENKKMVANNQDKKEKLQAMMENQAYNPFGRPGGGGPNKKIGFSNPNKYENNERNYTPQPNNNNNNMYPQNNIRNSYDPQENAGNIQPNDYYQFMQNNLQNLQKEKIKMENYKNFVNQNNQNNVNNPYIYENNGHMNPYQNQNFQNNNNFEAPENNYFPPQQQAVNNRQIQYGKQIFSSDINNFPDQQPKGNFNNPAFLNDQKFQKIESVAPFEQRNGYSVNQENVNISNQGANAGVPSFKVRTGRNRLMYENMGENEMVKKEAKAQEMQRALAEQIELKKRQKEIEKERKKMEEAAEEARIQREREQIEWEKKQEEEKKKAKFEKIQQENYDLKADKNFKKQKNDDLSKDITSENLAKKPLILRTDVSKEFLEQEGKKSRRRNRPTVVKQENVINYNNNEDFFSTNQNQDVNLYPEEKNNQFDIFNNNNNRGNEMVDFQMKRDFEIQNIKNEAKYQQKNMQQKLFEIQNEAANAIKLKNQAEQELINLRQVLKEKVLEEEKYKQDLLSALKKHDPALVKRNSNNLLNGPLQNKSPLNNIQNFQNFKNENTRDFNVEPYKFNGKFDKPLKIFEKGGITTNKEGFQEGTYGGDHTLISDTKLIPLDILDHYAKNNDNNPLTFSKIGNFAIRPNSSNIYENSNRFNDDARPIDSRDQSNRNFIIKKRPLSQKNQRIEKTSYHDQSINSEITKEIDQFIKSHQEELHNNKGSTFNQVAKGILQKPTNQMNQMSPYSQEGGIKLGSEFPTLKEQSLYSVKSFGMKQNENSEYNNHNNSNLEEIEKLLKNKVKQNPNGRYEENYKDQTLYSTLNLDDVNKKNDDRLKEIDMMEKYINGKSNKNNGNHNLDIIGEEDEIRKLDKLIRDL